MAKLIGMTKLTKTLKANTEEAFKVKVKKFVDSLSSVKNSLVLAQKKKLMNTNIRDGKTDFPHKRSGNLLDNLIDLKVESFREANFKKTDKYLSYTHTTINRLDGGGQGSTVFKIRKGQRINYASDLQKGDRYKKWNGYFERLQNIFRAEYLRNIRNILRGL